VGFTENESSTAWCGKNVVIGFNDTGSVLETIPPTTAGIALLGYSVSTNKGASFTDKGFPTLTSDTSSTLGFDQVFTCTSASNFYFSSLYNTSTETAVTVSSSSDGGQTFGTPVVVSSASNGGVPAGNVGHFFDGDWMAVNPANPQQLFVTYTNDDFTGARCGAGVFGNGIELVWSNDGGVTWSTPAVVTESCETAPGLGPVVEFSEVAVDPASSTVYVTWEDFGAVVAFPTLPRRVDIAKATIPGTLVPPSFGSPVKVSDINYAGMFDSLPPFGEAAAIVQILQGRILTFEHPKLAIGKGPKNAGVLYVAWNDGDHPVPDLATGEAFDPRAAQDAQHVVLRRGMAGRLEERLGAPGQGIRCAQHVDEDLAFQARLRRPDFSSGSALPRHVPKIVVITTIVKRNIWACRVFSPPYLSSLSAPQKRNTEDTKNHGEIGLSLSAAYSSASPVSSRCPLWFFSVFSVLNSEKRDQ